MVTALARPHVIVYIHTHTRAHGTHPVPAAESSLMKRFLGCVGDGAWRWDRVESKQRGEGATIIVVPIAMHSPDSIDRPTDPIRARDGGAHPVHVCIIGCRLPSRYPPHTPPMQHTDRPNRFHPSKIHALHSSPWRLLSTETHVPWPWWDDGASHFSSRSKPAG